MKDSTKSNLRRGALAIGAGAAGLGGAALLRKKKLRIGTPLSKSKVVSSGGVYARQAAGRAVELAERIDDRLREFDAIPLAEEPYSWEGSSSCCAPSVEPKKPRFPSMYIGRTKAPKLLKMGGEGRAVIEYKIKSRSVDEDTPDGQPLYGANIEIRSIEEMPAETGLESTHFLREFAGGQRDRDGAGRFQAGNIPSADEFAIADAAGRTGRKVAVGAGLAAAAGGAALIAKKRGIKFPALRGAVPRLA